MASTVSNLNEVIIRFFEKHVFEEGQKSHFVRRSSKLDALSFLKSLIGLCLSGTKITLEGLCSFLSSHSLHITRQGLHQRMNAQAVFFLKELFCIALNQFSLIQGANASINALFSAIYVIDSSVVSLPDSLKELYKGCGGCASQAAVKLQVLFDYLEGTIKELTLTSGRDNDQGFDKYFHQIKSKALYLMDLGYFKLESFQKISDGNAYFVSRYLVGTNLYTCDHQPIELLDTLKKTASIYSQKLLIGATARIPVRLVAYRLSDAVVKERTRKLKADYRRRGFIPGKEKLALLRWNLFITNLDEHQFNEQSLYNLYAIRWQIELLFKLSKSGLAIDKINSQEPARVLIELYGKLISLVLLLAFCSQAKQQCQKEISFFKACRCFYVRAYDFINSMNTVDNLKRFTNNFIQVLIHNALKENKQKKTCPIHLMEHCF